MIEKKLVKRVNVQRDEKSIFEKKATGNERFKIHMCYMFMFVYVFLSVCVCVCLYIYIHLLIYTYTYVKYIRAHWKISKIFFFFLFKDSIRLINSCRMYKNSRRTIAFFFHYPDLTSGYHCLFFFFLFFFDTVLSRILII